VVYIQMAYLLCPLKASELELMLAACGYAHIGQVQSPWLIKSDGQEPFQ
jgi:hypothetical protein